MGVASSKGPYRQKLSATPSAERFLSDIDDRPDGDTFASTLHKMRCQRGDAIFENAQLVNNILADSFPRNRKYISVYRRSLSEAPVQSLLRSSDVRKFNAQKLEKYLSGQASFSAAEARWLVEVFAAYTKKIVSNSCTDTHHSKPSYLYKFAAVGVFVSTTTLLVLSNRPPPPPVERDRASNLGGSWSNGSPVPNNTGREGKNKIIDDGDWYVDRRWGAPKTDDPKSPQICGYAYKKPIARISDGQISFEQNGVYWSGTIDQYTGIIHMSARDGKLNIDGKYDAAVMSGWERCYDGIFRLGDRANN